jgi:iron only hydrogenase large subunit-like protein
VVRGFDGIREASLDVGGTQLRVAVAHTLKNARAILDDIVAGTSPYAFVEVMSCPGGCLGGGGQPVAPDWKKREKRRSAIYTEDRGLELRKSHENPAIQALYTEFLKKPLGHESHLLLHTHYASRTV